MAAVLGRQDCSVMCGCVGWQAAKPSSDGAWCLQLCSVCKSHCCSHSLRLQAMQCLPALSKLPCETSSSTKPAVLTTCTYTTAAYQNWSVGRGLSSVRHSSMKSTCMRGSRFLASTRWTCHIATTDLCICSEAKPSFCHKASCIMLHVLFNKMFLWWFFGWTAAVSCLKSQETPIFLRMVLLR